MTIIDFAHAVVEISGTTSEIMFIQPEDERIRDDPQQRRPDISKARGDSWVGSRLLTLADGLAKTIDYFRDKVGAPAIKNLR